MNWKRFAAFAFALLAVVLFSYQPASAQATIATGSIQGLITDPQNAAVTTAKVSVTSTDAGFKLTPPVTSSGAYNTGPIVSGEYVVRFEASGFKTMEVPTTVRVGNITTINAALQLGSSSTVISVEATAERVNTEQSTIQGVVTQTQIDNLPINGRNFLDLAQLEPGVQIQDGGNFDPTKKGFASVSFGGRFGRTARIEVDGLDISDETVGTTTQNIPMNSIKEFQVSQSSLDIGTELTSSGTLNVTTKAGTNQIHGGGFDGYRDNVTGAIPSVYTRKQYGAELGGPFIKNKLFGFGSWERTTQDLAGLVVPFAPFTALQGQAPSPFFDNMFLGKVDYNLNSNIRVFFKFGYEQNRDVASFVSGTFQPFANVDNTPVYGVGVDFTTGSFTHSVRVGYMKFRNGIAASPLPFGPQNPAPDLALAIGNVSTSCTTSGDLWCSGINILAPQATFQSNKQFKYDGSKVLGTHIIRFGFGVNRIEGGGFASFFGLAPAVRGNVTAATDAFANTSSFGPGFNGGPGDTNPLNWPVHRIDVANGQGCFTENAGFGQTCGGQSDTRLQLYVGDSWKVRPNFTLSGGIRYNRDTGRTDSDLPAIADLNLFQAGLGNPVRQPNKNIGGTIGIAWDPWKSGKTIIRAGAGIYYENGVFNNVLFDRPGRLTAGLFNQVQEACTQGGIQFPSGAFVTSSDGLDIPSQICDTTGALHAIGNVEQAIVDLQAAYQADTAAAGPQANGAFFANCLDSTVCTGSMFAPNFQTPRSYQMNVGFQRELHPGTVISVDYLRNIGVHTLLGIDQNHPGDASILDAGTASAAIDATNASFSCGPGQAGVDCAIASGATIGNYAANGLGGGPNATGGFPVGDGVLAFPGVNPNFGTITLLEPIGRSVYNALQVSLRSDMKSPLPFIKHVNTIVSYSLSRFNSQADDTDFINGALDFNNPGRFIGPGSLDRTHQLSAGVVMQLPYGFRTDFISHWYTALAQTIFFNPNGGAEDIFQTDFYGDGQSAIAPVPGSNVGAFGRSVKAADLNAFLQSYDTKFGNQLTPAGNALVTAGLMTATQLQQLCAMTPSLNPINNCAAAYPTLQIAQANPGQVGNDALFTFDMTVGWSGRPIRKWENFRVEPNIKFFNLFNHPNYNSPTSGLSGVLIDPVLQPTVTGGINSTTAAQRRAGSVNLTGLGSGVFSFGAPRAIEFGFKVSF